MLVETAIAARSELATDARCRMPLSVLESGTCLCYVIMRRVCPLITIAIDLDGYGAVELSLLDCM
jgi:hypothetical protein